ncbi:MAG: PD40 domain-containing protein [Cryomorphaceae bacterium]|nr:PD40 domain-containing protein [Cryomorphaceae bacterium]
MLHIYRKLIGIICLLWVLPTQAQFFYGTYQTFGKNRVQFTDFDWNVYRMDDFDIYYYANDRVLPRKVAVMTHRNIAMLQRRLEANLDSRIQVLVFTTLSDLKQSNLVPTGDIPYNTGGVTQIAGNKIFVHFDGDYQKLEEQIRRALAEVMLTYILYGDLSESIRNSTLLNLPNWFLEGLVSYLSRPWTVEIDEKVREGIANKRFKRFNSLSDEDAAVAGHALWHFVAETYGKGVVRNILYMTIVNRNVETGFQYILGVEMSQLSANFRKFYRAKYNDMLENERLEGEEVKRIRRSREVGELAASRDGKYLAYVEHNLNEFRIYLYDTQRKRKKRIYKGGYKIVQNQDRSFPIMDWNPNGRILAFMTEEKGFTWLYFYDVEKKKLEKKKFFGSDKVNQFRYSPDGRQFVMSAVRNGRSNIFIYNILSTSYTAVTSDDYNDFYPTFINGGRDIVFSSDRPEAQLEPGKQVDQFNRAFDLFLYRISEGPEQEMRRVTNNASISDLQATDWGRGFLHFVRRSNGVRNDFLVKMDSNIAYVDTITHYDYKFDVYPVSNLTRNMRATTMVKNSSQLYYAVLAKRKSRIFRVDRDSPESFYRGDPEPEYDDFIDEDDDEGSDFEYVDVSEVDYEINIQNYQFDRSVLIEMGLYQGEVEREDRPSQQRPVLQSITIEEPQKEKDFNLPPRRNYFLSFYQDELTFQMDNTFLNPQYQPYTGRPDPNMLNPGFNGLIRVGAADLLEDYRITLGFRTNFTPLPGASLSPDHEIFISFLNQKKRLNHETFFFRRSQLELLSSAEFNRYFSHEVMHTFTYPFSPVSAVQFSGSVRMDHQQQLSRELNSLMASATYQYFGITRAAYIHDNTRSLGINLWEGTRYKIFTEYYRRLDISPSGLHTIGLDYRNYTKVHGPVIWANRFAGGTSFGQEKLVHFMGGVDNQFAPPMNTATPVADENYIFQTLVSNMRGFFQNTRNGNNFAVFNSELRIPIFRYLLRRPILNEFVSNFQVVPFFDVGTAWNGWNPYGEQNAINSQVIDRGSFTIIIDSNKEPIVMGTGLGLRTKLFGYFVRFDYAFGIEDGLVLPRVFHFSIGTDF